MIRCIVSTQRSMLFLFLGILLAPLLAMAQNVTPPGKAVTSARVKKQFASPPTEYSSAPLWVWNDRLTEAQIADTMADLARQKVKQVFVHPRPGLIPVAGVVQPVASGAARGREARYERLDLRREFVSLRFCRRTGS